MSFTLSRMWRCRQRPLADSVLYHQSNPDPREHCRARTVTYGRPPRTYTYLHFNTCFTCIACQQRWGASAFYASMRPSDAPACEPLRLSESNSHTKMCVYDGVWVRTALSAVAAHETKGKQKNSLANARWWVDLDKE
jgi:hypothetical protein